jgi:NAD(P)H-dependent flavin oxidoreductase YrpB (nitropropane dioxygenase family)
VSTSHAYISLVSDIFGPRYGASGVWVGTRFVASTEAGAPPKHKELVVSAGYDDIVRTLVYSGRPMNVRKTPYVAEWETQRQGEIAELVGQGYIPHDVELENHPERSLEGRMCKESSLGLFYSVSHVHIYRVDGQGSRIHQCTSNGRIEMQLLMSLHRMSSQRRRCMVACSCSEFY